MEDSKVRESVLEETSFPVVDLVDRMLSQVLCI